MKKILLTLLVGTSLFIQGCGKDDGNQPTPNTTPPTAPPPAPPVGQFSNSAVIKSDGATYNIPDVFALQNTAVAADGIRVYYIEVTGKQAPKGEFRVKYYIPKTNDLSRVSRVTLSIVNSRDFSNGTGTMTYKKATIGGVDRFVISGTFAGTTGEYKNATGTLTDVVVY